MSEVAGAHARSSRSLCTDALYMCILNTTEPSTMNPLNLMHKLTTNPKACWCPVTSEQGISRWSTPVLKGDYGNSFQDLQGNMQCCCTPCKDHNSFLVLLRVQQQDTNGGGSRFYEPCIPLDELAVDMFIVALLLAKKTLKLRISMKFLPVILNATLPTTTQGRPRGRFQRKSIQNHVSQRLRGQQKSQAAIQQSHGN